MAARWRRDTDSVVRADSALTTEPGRPSGPRLVLSFLLAVVAVAAAVLSFSALRDLAERCGFEPWLAWLLPITLDAGAAAGSVAWLTQPPGAARLFGRRLALVLLGASVVGNGVAHLLDAYQLAASWWLIVAVSALAPAVLAAVVHLAVSTTQAGTGRPELPDTEAPGSERSIGPAPGLSPVQVSDGVGSTDVEHAPDHAPQVGDGAAGDKLNQAETGTESSRQETGSTVPPRPTADELITAGAGRRRLARTLDERFQGFSGRRRPAIA